MKEIVFEFVLRLVIAFGFGVSLEIVGNRGDKVQFALVVMACCAWITTVFFLEG
jgi:uncharacterized membrane protein YjjB (DUF3815 family)